MRGTIVDYVCDEFYVETEGDNFTLACQDDGTWNSTAVPRCVLGMILTLQFFKEIYLQKLY